MESSFDATSMQSKIKFKKKSKIVQQKNDLKGKISHLEQRYELLEMEN